MEDKTETINYYVFSIIKVEEVEAEVAEAVAAGIEGGPRPVCDAVCSSTCQKLATHDTGFLRFDESSRDPFQLSIFLKQALALNL